MIKLNQVMSSVPGLYLGIGTRVVFFSLLVNTGSL